MDMLESFLIPVHTKNLVLIGFVDIVVKAVVGQRNENYDYSHSSNPPFFINSIVKKLQIHSG